MQSRTTNRDRTFFGEIKSITSPYNSLDDGIVIVCIMYCKDHSYPKWFYLISNIYFTYNSWLFWCIDVFGIGYIMTPTFSLVIFSVLPFPWNHNIFKSRTKLQQSKHMVLTIHSNPILYEVSNIRHNSLSKIERKLSLVINGTQLVNDESSENMTPRTNADSKVI